MQTGDKLLVEAGTGVGKSFAYLLPAIERITQGPAREDGKRQRVVVSTHTIALQEQLIQKDLPLLQAVDHPVVVDPDPQLSAVASRSGWPRLTLRAAATPQPSTQT